VTSAPGGLGEVARLFLKLGVIGFGGPAAHIALMREEVVRRRRWLSDERFLDLVGMASLIPGPTSTELSIYLGYVRAGWPGLLVGGSCFIGPAVVIVLALAWLYVRYGATPAAASALYGITPVIIAIVAHAMWGLGRTAVKGPLSVLVGLGVLALALTGVNVLVLLVAGGVVVMLRQARAPRAVGLVAALTALGGAGAASGQTAAGATVTLGTLFLTFLKIGAVLYGSGYVLLAFLRDDLVERLGWLTDRQLLDAVAVGQFTPGPVFTTATFIGYVLLPRLRRAPWAGTFLDGVNVAALALMAAVTWQLARAAIVDGFTVALLILSGAALLAARVNSAWLIVGGAAAGLVYRFGWGA